MYFSVAYFCTSTRARYSGKCLLFAFQELYFRNTYFVITLGKRTAVIKSDKTIQVAKKAEFEQRPETAAKNRFLDNLPQDIQLNILITETHIQLIIWISKLVVFVMYDFQILRHNVLLEQHQRSGTTMGWLKINYLLIK